MPNFVLGANMMREIIENYILRSTERFEVLHNQEQHRQIDTVASLDDLQLLAWYETIVIESYLDISDPGPNRDRYIDTGNYVRSIK